jgi:hypothetical protein
MMMRWLSRQRDVISQETESATRSMSVSELIPSFSVVYLSIARICSLVKIFIVAL